MRHEPKGRPGHHLGGLRRVIVCRSLPAIMHYKEGNCPIVDWESAGRRAFAEPECGMDKQYCEH